MKLAVKFLLFLLVLLALWIAHERYLYEELRVAFGGYEIAPPISIALVALATAALAIYVALKIGGFILFLPGKLRRRRAENQMKKRAETLLAGLRAMAMGDADSQEKHFGRAADMGIEPSLTALIAAEGAAASRRADKKDKREKRLQQALAAAEESDGELKTAVRAQLLMAQGQIADAAAALREAEALKSPSPLLAELLLESCRKSGDSDGALEAANRLRELQADESDSLNALAIRLAKEKITAAADADSLQDLWKRKVSARDKSNPSLLAAFALKLDSLGDSKSALGVVIPAIKLRAKLSAPLPPILEAAAVLSDNSAPADALRAAENLPDIEREDSAMLRALGSLASRQELWGKAEKYFQMANARTPDARNFFGLAALYQKMGKTQEEINAAYRRARELAAEE